MLNEELIATVKSLPRQDRVEFAVMAGLIWTCRSDKITAEQKTDAAHKFLGLIKAEAIVSFVCEVLEFSKKEKIPVESVLVTLGSLNFDRAKKLSDHVANMVDVLGVKA